MPSAGSGAAGAGTCGRRADSSGSLASRTLKCTTFLPVKAKVRGLAKCSGSSVCTPELRTSSMTRLPSLIWRPCQWISHMPGGGWWLMCLLMGPL
jgi:hypothetical protein